MNWVDLVIILLVILSIFRGIEAGLLRLLLSSLGFIGGLLLGSWIATHIASHYTSELTKLLIIILVEFGLAVAFAAGGEYLAMRLDVYTHKFRLGKANQVLGAALEVIFILFVVWLLSSALQNVRSNQIGRQVRGSQIIRWLDAIMPDPPDVLARVENILDPNGFPNVFLGPEPKHTTVAPTNKVNSQAVLADEKSVVQIVGDGCGGVVFGSGFVADRGIVVTNAHVVAGITHPKVVDQFGRYAATTIWFDQNQDVAILRVPQLTDPPLKLAGQTLPDNDAVVDLGYPHGGPLVVADGVIIDHIAAAGRNIYNQGVVLRNIYEVQTNVQPGDSGGPLVSPDGSVAGVVFAKSLSQDNVGYALLIDEVKPMLQKAEQRSTPVATGSCTAD